MLAQNFQTAEALGITDTELDALIKVLGMLERGELDGHFDMGNWLNHCGTVGCIAGTAHIVTDGVAFPWVRDLMAFFRGEDRGLSWKAVTSYPRNRPFLWDLFTPEDEAESVGIGLGAIKPAQAAIALRNYLSSGEPRWAEALAE